VKIEMRLIARRANEDGAEISWQRQK